MKNDDLLHESNNTSFITNLKASTAAIHKTLEDAQLSKEVMSSTVNLNSYTKYLRAIYTMHKTTEEQLYPVVKTVIKDTGMRIKHVKIEQDLFELGIQPQFYQKSFLDENYSNELNFSLGIMYVVEGSTLGGQIILKNIRNSIGSEVPSRFFNVYGQYTGSLWKKFLSQLNDYQTLLTATQRNEIIAGAIYAFKRAKFILSN